MKLFPINLVFNYFALQESNNILNRFKDHQAIASKEPKVLES